MSLTSVALQNFRGYSKKTFSFSEIPTLIVGANAAGKTNLLEAIMYLATGKSFRAGSDREVIRWGEDMSHVSCVTTPDTKLDLVITQSFKRYLVNGVSRRQMDFIGNLRAVLFWPEDLKIVTDSPSVRRRYLDTVLVQADREYRRSLQSYEKGLRQRNKLLDLIGEGAASKSQLLFWNQLLIKAGGYITDMRAGYIDFVNSVQLSAVSHQLIYDKSVISESRLEQYKDEEIAAKATLVGPHRDDVVIRAENRDLAKFGSRGEQRIAVLWLKLAELGYIKQATGVRPLLLLDDIFSELDDANRLLIGQLVQNQQTIITSADNESVPETIRNTAHLIEV